MGVAVGSHTHKQCGYISSPVIQGACEWLIDLRSLFISLKICSLVVSRITRFSYIKWINCISSAPRYQNWAGLCEDQYIPHLSSQKNQPLLRYYCYKGKKMATYPSAVLAEFVDATIKGLNFGYQGSNSVEWIRETKINWLTIIR